MYVHVFMHEVQFFKAPCTYNQKATSFASWNALIFKIESRDTSLSLTIYH